MKSLYLDPDTWDLVATSSRRVRTTEGKYCRAQCVATAVRRHKGEAYYDTERGVPYFETMYGQLPPDQLIRAHVEREALHVSGVEQARLQIRTFEGRTVTGDIRITDSDGEVANVSY